MADGVTLRICLSCGARSQNPARHGPTLYDEARKALRRASALSVVVEASGCNDLCHAPCSAVVLEDGRAVAHFGRLATDAQTAAMLVGYASAVIRNGADTPIPTALQPFRAPSPTT